MSTYLVAVVVTWDYKSVESNLVEGGPITKVSIYSFRNELHPSTQKQVWAPSKDVEAGRADYAAFVGPPLIKFYEDTYAIK